MVCGIRWISAKPEIQWSSTVVECDPWDMVGQFVGKCVAWDATSKICVWEVVGVCAPVAKYVVTATAGRCKQVKGQVTAGTRQVPKRKGLGLFLDASLHLYMRVCPSVGRSVRNPFFFKMPENDK